MSSERQCKRCGAEVTTYAPAGLCPRCMLEDALQEAATETGLESSPSRESGGTFRRLGHYEILEEIGRGGMGIVFRARQSNLNRLVALKLILAGPLAPGSFLRRFHTEAEAAAKLDHPNIVPIYEIGEHEGQHYLSMKLVEGSTLAGLIRLNLPPDPEARAERRLEPADRARWAVMLMVKVARAVHYAHQRGVLHRDLKPGNILVDTRNEPYVADFGLAKVLERDSSLTLSESVLGTPAYMAPEQAAGGARAATTAADIYSLGAVLYELLTGRQPFSGNTPLQIIRQAAETEPARPRLLNPKVDRDLETICLKCLEKEASARYGSAEALADDMERWLRQEPISARPTGILAQAQKWVRRRPLVAALTGSVALLFILGFAGVSWQWRRAEQRGVDLALNVYAAEMQLALQSWDEGNTANALRLLDKHRAAPWRGFEWRHLSHLSRAGLATLRIQGDFASEVAFSPDGKRLAIAEHRRVPQPQHSVGIWDTTSRQRMAAFPLLSRRNDLWWIGGFTFLEGGRILAADCNDGVVRRWDISTGKEELLLPQKTEGCWPPRLSPDGKWLVGVFRKNQARYYDLRVFETTSGTEVGTRLSVPMAGSAMNDHKVRCSPDSKLLAMATRPNVVRVFSLPALEEIVTFLVMDQPEVIAFTDRSEILAVAGFDASIQLWEIGTGKLVRTLRGTLKTPSHDLCFSPDGSLLACSGYASVIALWDLKSGTERAIFQGHRGRINSLAFSPDGKLLASGGGEDGTVRLWETAGRSGSPLQKPRTNGLLRIAFSPDNRLLAATAIDATVQLFDAATEELVAILKPRTNSTDASLSWLVRDLPLDFSPDGRLLAVGNGNRTASVWDVRERREIHVLANHASFVQAVAFAPDGKTLLTASEDKTICLWDASSAELRYRINAKLPLKFASFSPDGNLIAYSESTGMLSLWDVRLQKAHRSWRAHPTRMDSVAFSADGRLLASSTEGTVKLWDVRSGAELAQFAGLQAFVFSLRFTPDGKNLIGCDIVGQVRLWHLPSLREAGTLKTPVNLVSSALSRDGNVLATCSVEGGVRVFRAASIMQPGTSSHAR